MNLKSKKFNVLFCFIILSLFVSCEKDIYDDTIKTTERNVTSEFVTGNDARLIVSKLTKSLRKKYSLNQMESGRIEMESIGIILYDEIVKVTDSTGKSTYSFKVDHPDSSISKFYNLILQEKAEGNIIKLMEYTMTPEFAQQFAETFNYKDFRGTLSSYTIINETPCPDNDITLISIGQVGGSSGGADPTGGEPTGGDPTSGNPTGGDPTGGNPTGGNPTGGNPTGGNPTGGNSGSGGDDYSLEYLEMIIDCISSGGTWDYTDGNCVANPRYFRMSIDPIEEEPCNPIIHFVVITPNTTCEKEFLQGNTHLNWLYENQGTEEYAEIMNYVNGDGTDCSQERKNVANELIREIKSGSIIDFENKIILDSSFVHNQKANCVYNKLKTNNSFNQVLTPFNVQNPKAFVKMTTGPVGNNDRARATPPDTNNIILITINNDPTHINGINKRPNVLLAQTIVHEILHAELFRRILVAIGNGTYSTLTMPQLIYALQHSQYSDLVDYIRTANDWSHEYMADQWRETIAKVTQEFATGIEVAGTPDQLYMNLSWLGLNSPDVYVWTDVLDQNDRDTINQVINDYTNTHLNQTCE